jgi:hypothetical protein
MSDMTARGVLMHLEERRKGGVDALKREKEGHNQIGRKEDGVAGVGDVVAGDLNGRLLNYGQTRLAEFMRQGVFIDLFQMTVFVVPMDRITGFSYPIAKLHDVVVHGVS